MKKIILGLFTLFMALSLSACSDNSNPTPGLDEGKTEEKPDEDKNPDGDVTEEPDEDVEEFVIQTADNGLSASQSSYSFVTAEEGDLFPPEASIVLETDDSWNSCTGLNERYTKIIAEDENVLPANSVSLEIVTNQDIVGSSGSNEIEQIKIVFDRDLIQVGESKLKIQVQPYNGSSTIAKLTTICLDIEVKEFGSIIVDTYNIGLNVDLTGLSDIIDELGIEPLSINLNFSDDEEIYGYSADDMAQVKIDSTDSIVSVENFKFAVGHTYSAWIYVDCDDAYDRVWIALEAKTESSDYEVKPNENNSESSVTVNKDNITIDCVLGDYYQMTR